MHKKYTSGAAKRKAKAEKDERDKKLLEKIPKLTDFRFGTQKQVDENTESQSTTECSVDPNSKEPSNANESVSDFEFESCESSIGISSLSIDAQSNDPGLWNLQSNQSSLQAYWVKHGNLYFIILELYFITQLNVKISIYIYVTFRTRKMQKF